MKVTTIDLSHQNPDFPYSLACMACSKKHRSDTMLVFHGNLQRRSS
jgi:hypothetical protein